MHKAKGGKRNVAGTASGRLFFFCLLPSAFCLLPSAFCLPSPSLSPAANRGGGPLTYDSFRLVHSRNVFDPDRRPARPSVASTAAPTTRADYVALTGIAVDGEKSLAFFSGSRSDFNAVIPVGSKIAGATVAKINLTDVEVDRNGRHLVVAVGQTIPLDDKSAPAAAPASQPAAAPVSTPTAVAAAPGAVPAGSPPGAPPASTANLDDIRRRMMERRSQEQK